MTQEQEAASMQVIDFCRHFNRRMAEKQAEQGARIDDIAIAAAYSAVDLASCHVGDTPSAIAWVRRALDVMEAGLPLTVETLQ
jgi:hypothetical protein